MRLGRVLQVAVGAVTLVAGLAVSGIGASLLWANATQRDSTGYFNTPFQTFESSGSAVVSSVDLTMHPGPNDWLSYHPLGTLRLRAQVTGGVTFVGIARTSAVDQYLAGVAYDQVRSVRVLPFGVAYRTFAGSRTPLPPATQALWVASASGTGVQQITWRPESGKWSVVVMRGDARAGVVARASVGTNTGLVVPLGSLLLAGGVLLLLAGGALLGLGVIALGRSSRSEPRASDSESAASVPTASSSAESGAHAYPARLDGRLDAPLSRWRWIFKWILIVPHIFVLVFLWLAVMALTVVAGVSILFTGRYPRSIFDFTVGVIRWTWRVAFYAFSALATDRYPPFSLDVDDRFPAAFDVDYPSHLSRGLVLVKWWLLAIPQYVIVGILMGGGLGFGGRLSSNWSFATGGGVIGLLVVVAGLILLFTGRYPPAVFDFVMGLNRWCYRVLAYVLLLRDEYPPFRFDAGGTDPGSATRIPAAPAPSDSGPPTESPRTNVDHGEVAR